MSRKLFGYVKKLGVQTYTKKEEIYRFCKLNNLYLDNLFEDIVQDGCELFNYKKMKTKIINSGDSLIITNLEQLGEDRIDILSELIYFRDKKIRLIVLNIPSTASDISKLDLETSELVGNIIIKILIEMYENTIYYNKDLEYRKISNKKIICMEKIFHIWNR